MRTKARPELLYVSEQRGHREAEVFAFAAARARRCAGTGYELAAITAVVLGGTSIFGGVGSVAGTLLGVAAIAILTNGLGRVPATLSLAGELSGLFTGVVLILALTGGAVSRWWTELRGWRRNRG